MHSFWVNFELRYKQQWSGVTQSWQHVLNIRNIQLVFSLNYFIFLVKVNTNIINHTENWTPMARLNSKWNLEFSVTGFKQRITAVITLFYGKTLYQNQKDSQNFPQVTSHYEVSNITKQDILTWLRNWRSDVKLVKN